LLFFVFSLLVEFIVLSLSAVLSFHHLSTICLSFSCDLRAISVLCSDMDWNDQTSRLEQIIVELSRELTTANENLRKMKQEEERRNRSPFAAIAQWLLADGNNAWKKLMESPLTRAWIVTNVNQCFQDYEASDTNSFRGYAQLLSLSKDSKREYQETANHSKWEYDKNSHTFQRHTTKDGFLLVGYPSYQRAVNTMNKRIKESKIGLPLFEIEDGLCRDPPN